LKKINVDLIVGASILTALFILVAGLVWLKEASIANKMVNYMVIFPEVGTLQLGDPVYVNGVKKGTVSKIELRGTEVATVLNLDKKINMTDSVRVSVVNVGLLGERGIGVTCRPTGRRSRTSPSPAPTPCSSADASTPAYPRRWGCSAPCSPRSRRSWSASPTS